MKFTKHFSKLQRVSFDLDAKDIKDAILEYLQTRSMGYPNAKIEFEIADMSLMGELMEYHAFVNYILEEEEIRNE